MIVWFKSVSDELHASQPRHLVLWVIAAACCAFLGSCATVPMQRAEVEKLHAVDVVRVATPPLYINTFLRALAAQNPSLLTGAAAASDTTPVAYKPPAIPDFGDMVTRQLLAELGRQVPWWPSTNYVVEPVSASYVHGAGPWMRVEVFSYEVAPGFGRLLIGVEVSMRRATGEPLWVARHVFSGIVHGGEKIEIERLPNDTSQLEAELRRAATWIVAATVEEIQEDQK